MIQMTKICPQCKMENEDNAKFCRKCGVSMEGVDSVSSDNIAENKWVLKLFYWHNRWTQESRPAKSKIISEIVYLLVFVYGINYYFIVCGMEYGLVISIIATFILPLVFALPVFAVGFLAHKVIG